jgi:hypothetical protein
MIVLVGCGGGGEANGTSGTGKQKLVFDAVNRVTGCLYKSKPLPGVQFIAHSADGKVIQSFSTDQNGHIEADWPENARHATAIYRAPDGKFTVNSILDVTTTDFGKYYFGVDNTPGQCSCTTLNIDWSDIKASHPEFQLSVSGELQYNLNTTSSVSGYRVCANDVGQYGKVQFMLIPSNAGQSFAMEADISSLLSSSTVKLNFSQFKSLGRLLDVVSNINSYTVRTYTPNAQGRGYLSSIQYPGPYTARVFETNESKATAAISYTQASDGYSSSVTRRVAVSKNENSVFIPAPINQPTIVQSIQNSLINASGAGSINYDFSYLTDYASTNYSLSSYQVDIEFSGPMKAQIPVFEWPADLMAVMQNGSVDFELEVYFLGYGANNDYRTYQQRLANRSRNPGLEVQDPALSDYRFLSIFFGNTQLF